MPASVSSTILRASQERIIEAAGWAHARRKFFDLARLQKAPIAIEAVKRIDALFAIERVTGLRSIRDQATGRSLEICWKGLMWASAPLSAE